MKHLPVSVLLACSAVLSACGGAQDSNATQEKTLASTHRFSVEADAISLSSTDTDSFAPRGFPEDRAGYQPVEAGTSATAEN